MVDHACLALLSEALYSRYVVAPRRRHAVPRIAALLAFGCLAGALAGVTGALVSACADDSEVTAVATEGGEGGGPVSTVDCPMAEPPGGSECPLPEGTTCDFGRCGTRLARCTQGRWMVGANVPPSPPCPEAPPNPAVSCPACWPAAISCTYGSSDCSAADASVNTAIASCPNGTWVVDIRPCRDGGGREGGPDVQGDGGPDAG